MKCTHAIIEYEFKKQVEESKFVNKKAITVNK